MRTYFADRFLGWERIRKISFIPTNFSKIYFILDPSAIDLLENKEDKVTENDNLSFEKELRLMQKVFF